MTLEELIIDEQLPDHWRRALKRGETEMLGNSISLRIVGEDFSSCFILFTYDQNRSLVIKVL